MVQQLGYPKSLIAVEKGMAAFGLPDTSRRIDILCFMPGKEGLKPLLLIECKVEDPNQAAAEQLFGYNKTVEAPFIALASKEGVKLMWREQGKIVSIPFLPSFTDLVDKCQI